MNSKILDGRKLGEKLNKELKEKIKQVVKKIGIKPTLATILVGKDPSSKIYINIKQRMCQEVGIESIILELDENISKDDLLQEIDKLNNEPSVHGILLQLPLPEKLLNYTGVFLEKISPLKDVDGLNPFNKGRLFDYDEELAPCTPKGIIALLKHYNIEISGKNAVIINRSNLVGKPLIFMLLKRNATPTVCHTSTRNIDRYIKNADLLIVAVRKPKFITKERIKEGVIIIDVGTNRIEGKLCGDVDFDDVLDKCGAISPSPGGVGPLTVHFLLQNTFNAYKKQLNITEI
ncbi:MAG: bifunctional 5,10-methylenetetrahydrofolate dehydrogenase/5,10-methenyltetrahydrofolate cyclohydrolase [Promethearchaeota archaeon]|nr:MAG: bifunctional 5,10-methylenetetrahydrofolate dehydrogenase/5,10-methenyltetrahydrofolate cyclohydrolase [Candidatus Lokiarchaeota archaeon]